MRALICGAGIAGLTLARMLDGMGWDVRLIERAPALRGEGYMIDFFGPGFDAAQNMGLLPGLRDLADSPCGPVELPGIGRQLSTRSVADSDNARTTPEVALGSSR